MTKNLIYLLGCSRMVHEQEDTQCQTSSRKRSYPWIHWIQSESPPHSRSSPEPENESRKDSEEEDSFQPALPSPPLQSRTFKTFKRDLDKFGGTLKKNVNGNGLVAKNEEKVIPSKSIL